MCDDFFNTQSHYYLLLQETESLLVLGQLTVQVNRYKGILIWPPDIKDTKGKIVIVTTVHHTGN